MALHRNLLKKLPEAKRVNLLDAMRDKLRQLAAAGDFDGNPDDWYPATDIVALAYAPGTNPSLKFLCLKTAADLVHIPVAAQMKVDAGIQGDTNVTVVVQPWAAQIRPADIIVEQKALTAPDSRADNAAE